MKRNWSYESTKLQDVMVCGEYKRGVAYSASEKCKPVKGVIEKIVSGMKRIVDSEYDTKMRMRENRELVKKSDELEEELEQLNGESKELFNRIKELREVYETKPAPLTYHVIPKMEYLLKKVRVVHAGIEKKIKEMDVATCKIKENTAKIAKNNNRGQK